MKFKLSSTGEARTDDYMGTVTTLHDSDLERIKENVRIHNRQVRATPVDDSLNFIMFLN